MKELINEIPWCSSIHLKNHGYKCSLLFSTGKCNNSQIEPEQNFFLSLKDSPNYLAACSQRHRPILENINTSLLHALELNLPPISHPVNPEKYIHRLL